MNTTEIESLRTEIQNWQGRKFTVVGATIAFSTGINGWIAANGDYLNWHVAGTLPLLLLIGSMLLTWLAGRFNILIGTYLETFHDSPWEARQRLFRSEQKINLPGLNTIFALIYVAIGIVSCVISFISGSDDTTIVTGLLFYITAIVYLLVLYILIFKSYPRDRDITQWREIQRREESE